MAFLNVVEGLVDALFSVTAQKSKEQQMHEQYAHIKTEAEFNSWLARRMTPELDRNSDTFNAGAYLDARRQFAQEHAMDQALEGAKGGGKSKKFVDFSGEDDVIKPSRQAKRPAPAAAPATEQRVPPNTKPTMEDTMSDFEATNI
jgi:hypothetical protein